MSTSGLIYQLNEDDTALIGYEDYNVGIFDGDDYEVMYYLDSENFKLLVRNLPVIESYDIKTRLIEQFSWRFNSVLFEEFCEKNNIKYFRNIWIG